MAVHEDDSKPDGMRIERHCASRFKDSVLSPVLRAIETHHLSDSECSSRGYPALSKVSKLCLVQSLGHDAPETLNASDKLFVCGNESYG
jgi:hypothetical protein